MAREHRFLSQENFQVPLHALTFEGFRRWVHSAEFPETGRIDFLNGDVESDMSPEDLHTHGIVKMAVASALHALVAGRLGETFTDRARVVSRFASLSVEPDVVVVLWNALQAGRVRYVPASSQKPDRFVEMEGAPNLVVEVVSDSSQRKDTKKLPPLYARAGVPELWIVDTRGREIRFQIHVLEDGRYRLAEPDAEGWLRSPQLDLAFRLVRQPTPVSSWYYVLEHRASS